MYLEIHRNTQTKEARRIPFLTEYAAQWLCKPEFVSRAGLCLLICYGEILFAFAFRVRVDGVRIFRAY